MHECQHPVRAAYPRHGCPRPARAVSDQQRLVPGRQQVPGDPLHEHDVDGVVADHLIRDRDIATSRVRHVRVLPDEVSTIEAPTVGACRRRPSRSRRRAADPGPRTFGPCRSMESRCYPTAGDYPTHGAEADGTSTRGAHVSTIRPHRSDHGPGARRDADGGHRSWRLGIARADSVADSIGACRGGGRSRRPARVATRVRRRQDLPVCG